MQKEPHFTLGFGERSFLERFLPSAPVKILFRIWTTISAALYLGKDKVSILGVSCWFEGIKNKDQKHGTTSSSHYLEADKYKHKSNKLRLNYIYGSAIIKSSNILVR